MQNALIQYERINCKVLAGIEKLALRIQPYVVLRHFLHRHGRFIACQKCLYSQTDKSVQAKAIAAIEGKVKASALLKTVLDQILAQRYTFFSKVS
jgi:hypothetical protein